MGKKILTRLLSRNSAVSAIVFAALICAPVLAADIPVTNLQDSGAGSFRAAISTAHDNDTITFDPGLVGTISLVSPLPALNSVELVNASPITVLLANASTKVAMEIGSGKTIKGTLPGNLRIDGTGEIFCLQSTGLMTFDEDLSGVIDSTSRDIAIGLFSWDDMVLEKGLSGSVTASVIKGTGEGLHSSKDMVFNGDLSGSVAARSENGTAFGLWAEEDISLQDMTGSITASAGGTWTAGIWSDGSITVQNLTGSITALAGGNKAYGLSAAKTMFFGSDLSGSVAASAGGDESYGLFSSENMTLDGDLSGSVEASAGGDRSYGLLSFKNMTLGGGLSGSVTAAAGRGLAYGLASGTDLIIKGDLSGSVRALAKENYAVGLDARDVLNLKGKLSGSIVALAGGDGAYGMRGGDGIFVAKDLSGSVEASAGGEDAFGLRAFSRGLSLENLSGSINATAGTNNAYGIGSFEDNLVISGDLSGTVAASAGGHTAMGLHSEKKEISIQSLTGSITASAGGNIAHGLSAAKTMFFGSDLSGSVAASAGGDESYGLFSSENMTLNGGLSGSVSAAAGGRNAYGLASDSDLVINGDLSGSVEASAGGEDAFGLRAFSKGLSLENLSGSINATAGTNKAYGIGSLEDNLVISGDLSGTVAASAGGHTAMGLYSGTGGMNNGAGGAMNISGSVSAIANGLAMAAAGGGGINLNVTGNLLAADLSGQGDAYAVRAGHLDLKSKEWRGDDLSDDTITLGNGANVSGRIELGKGVNLLTLDGAGTLNGDVGNITTMAKTGKGIWAARGKIHTHDLNVEAGTLSLDSSASHVFTNNLVVAPGAILTAVVRNRAADVISLGNTLTNSGQIDFLMEPFFVPSGTTFTLVTSNGLLGTGDYTTSSQFLSVNTKGNNVEATKKSYSDMHFDTINSQRLAALFDDSIRATPSGDLATILISLESSSSPGEFNESMKQLGVIPMSGISALGMDMSRIFSSAVQTRMAEMRSSHIMTADKKIMDPEDSDTWPMLAFNGDLAGILGRRPLEKPDGLHLRMLGQTGGQDSHDGYDGYDYNTIALSGGLDHMVSEVFGRESLLAGISLGYASTSADYLDTGKSRADMESYSLGLYGTWFDKGWYVDTALGGAWNEYEVRRAIAFMNRIADSDFSGYTLSAKTECGYRIDTWDFGLTPMVSLEYTRFHQKGYTETGAGGANLSVDSTDNNSLRTGLGGRVDNVWSTGFGRIIPRVSAMWMHELVSSDTSVNTTMAGMPGVIYPSAMARPDQDTLILGLGTSLVNDAGIALSLHYQGQIQENADSHSLNFDFTLVF
ncbi:autotransporter outer membrane beta-barrel domain-containing protein [Desulfoluna sp.]|uniref:autotransporter family protein n=1 Tax=Desulfoluna sp. TaxID=2045199 RepID=UPI0026343F48|nr:autotransporter outer membrane beta-barrel domain-containing protein [Desulfoluna sp.]